MIDPYHVPNDTHEADIHYKARKQQLIELFAMISKERMITVSQISGTVSNLIEELDEILEGQKMSTFKLKIIHGGVNVVELETEDIDEVKTAIEGFEYELSEMISGQCDDS